MGLIGVTRRENVRRGGRVHRQHEARPLAAFGRCNRTHEANRVRAGGVVTDASCTLRTWLTPSAEFESQYGELSGINPNQVEKCWQIFGILCPQMRYLRQ